MIALLVALGLMLAFVPLGHAQSGFTFSAPRIFTASDAEGGNYTKLDPDEWPGVNERFKAVQASDSGWACIWGNPGSTGYGWELVGPHTTYFNHTCPVWWRYWDMRRLVERSYFCGVPYESFYQTSVVISYFRTYCPAGYTEVQGWCSANNQIVISACTLNATQPTAMNLGGNGSCSVGSGSGSSTRTGGNGAADGSNGGPSFESELLGNPVHIGYGNKVDLARDVDGVLNLGRTYNARSAAQSDKVFASGWTHSYARVLRFAWDNAAVYVHRPDGKSMPYTVSGATATGLPNVDLRLVPVSPVLADGTAWKLINPGGEVESYDAAGRLLSIAASTGRMRVLARDANGRLQSVTDETGRQLSFTYDSKNRVATVTDPNGGQYLYAYDEASSYVVAGQPLGNNLTSVTYPGGLKRVYHYNEQANTSNTNLPNALTGISDEVSPGVLVRYGTYKYDAQGRAISSEHAGGADRYQFNYVTPYAQTVVTDPLGTQRTYNFSTILGVIKQTSVAQPPGAGSSACSDALTHDANGNVASRTDFNGNRSCYANDLTRNLETARVEGLSGGASCPADVAGYVPAANTAQRKILIQWHPDWRLEVRRAEPKKITTRVYNGQVDPTTGSVVTCAPAGALVDSKPIAVLCRRIEQVTTDETGAQGFGATAVGAPRIWAHTYNQWGQVLTEDGSRTDVADVTTYEYRAADDTATPKKYRRGDLWKITNALGHVTEFTDYDGNGRALRVVDPNGLVTEFSYSPRGWLIQLRQTQTGGSTNQSTVYQYDGVGQLQQVTLPDGSAVTYTYDDARRLTQVADSLNNRIVYTLDAMGNRLGEQAQDPGGVLTRNLTRVIDALSRLQSVTGGLQ